MYREVRSQDGRNHRSTSPLAGRRAEEAHRCPLGTRSENGPSVCAVAEGIGLRVGRRRGQRGAAPRCAAGAPPERRSAAGDDWDRCRAHRTRLAAGSRTGSGSRRFGNCWCAKASIYRVADPDRAEAPRTRRVRTGWSRRRGGRSSTTIPFEPVLAQGSPAARSHRWRARAITRRSDYLTATMITSSGLPLLFFDSCFIPRPMNSASPRFHAVLALPSTFTDIASLSPSAMTT